MPMWIKGQRIWADREQMVKELADKARLDAGQRPNNSKKPKLTELELDIIDELIKECDDDES